MQKTPKTPKQDRFALHFPKIDQWDKQLITKIYHKYANSPVRIFMIDFGNILCSAHGKDNLYGEGAIRGLLTGTISNLDLAYHRTIDLLKDAGEKGLRISQFYGKFPKQTWMLQDQMCVPYSVIKKLEGEGRVKFEYPRFFYNK